MNHRAKEKGVAVVHFIGDDGKTCTQCAKTLSRDDFYKKGSSLDSRCKACTSAKKKEIYLSKKAPEDNSFKDIFILPFRDKMTTDAGDLIDALEAFLLEEFDGGQAVTF